MADLKDITTAKAVVTREISKRLDKTPAIGLYELVGNELKAMGHECTDITNPEELKSAIKDLSHKEKNILKKDFKEYQKEYVDAVIAFKQGNHMGLTKLPAKALSVIAKGASHGIAAAAVVNTVVPNLFPTAMGYLSASFPNMAAKIATFSLSALSTPAIAQGIVLGTGAVIGATAYTIGKTISSAGKGVLRKVRNHRRSNRDEKNNESR